MIDRAGIELIMEQYRKHGWNLRRVLLSESLRRQIGDVVGLFGKAEILNSELDAAWFSRSSRPETTAWELRHLAETPYAIVAGIPEHAESSEAETALRDAEAKMRDVARSGKFGN